MPRQNSSRETVPYWPLQQSLKSLYERGMIGWGKKHAAAVVIAMETTGLTENQVKVCVLRNLKIHMI